MYKRGENNKNSKVKAGYEFLCMQLSTSNHQWLICLYGYPMNWWFRSRNLSITTKLEDGEHHAIHNENTSKTLNSKSLKLYENSWHEPWTKPPAHQSHNTHSITRNENSIEQ